ncbi:MAG: formate/nitrite family transporter [Actinomycetota bacterium]
MTTTPDPAFDALLPAEMAHKAETVGVVKAALPLRRLIPLGVLAGAFIALGAHFFIVVTAGTGLAPGVSRLLGGLVFSLGLILVVVSGAELFTGNTLIVIACANRRVRLRAVLRNWGVVYVANFVGAAATSCLVVWSGRFEAGDGSMGKRALDVALAKSGLPFFDAFVSGLLANALVCLAVWMSMSARSLTDRVFAIVPPVTAFVAAGFEHSIANMYFFPAALLHRAWAGDSFWKNTETTSAAYDDITWGGFALHNLVPVTLGNLVGGAVLVGLVYWFVYLRDASPGPGR